MPKDEPTQQGVIIRQPDEAWVIEIVERVLHAQEDQRSMEREVSARELQVAVLEIRDAIKMQASAVAELTRAIQLVASRGSSGVGGL